MYILVGIYGGTLNSRDWSSLSLKKISSKWFKMTFWSPIVGGHLYNCLRGHVTNPKQVTKTCQVKVFVGHKFPRKKSPKCWGIWASSMNMNAYRSKADMWWMTFLRSTNWCGALLQLLNPPWCILEGTFWDKVPSVTWNNQSQWQWKVMIYKMKKLFFDSWWIWGFSQNFYPQVSQESLSGLQKKGRFSLTSQHVLHQKY